MNKNLILLGAATLGALSIGSSANANLVVNGGFESPAVSSWGLSNTIPGWTSTGAQIEVGRGTVYGVTGFEALNVLELDSTANSTVSQTLSLASGSYDLSFLYGRRVSGMSGKPADTADFDVLWNGSSIFATTPTTGAMAVHSMSVIALAGDNTLSFRGRGTSDSYGAIIDNVQLNASPVPEPASLAALAVGAFGLLRRKSKNA